MSSLYSKLSVLKDDEDFFLNSRTNKTVKEIQKELNPDYAIEKVHS